MASRALIATIAAGLATAAPARANDPVANFENRPVAALQGTRLSQAQVRDAIVAGASARNWKVNYVAAGLLVAQLKVAGRHLVEVDIRYGPQYYSVLYRDSINMNYRTADATIHPSYNRWTRELVESIDYSIRRTGAE
jgi:hypothetical protein